jgi:hypothetical protein
MKTLQFLFIVLLATITYAQEEEKKNEKDRKFSISLEQINYTQQVKENDDHLTNEPSFSGIIKVGYRFSKYTKLKTGFQNISNISFAGLTYDQYKIPLLFSSEISLNNKKKSNHTRLVADVGVYLRIINGFDNETAVNYEENTVFGFQGSLSVEHDITRLLFVSLGVRNNNDFSDLLESADSNISVNSYGFFFGLGFRL